MFVSKVVVANSKRRPLTVLPPAVHPRTSMLSGEDDTITWDEEMIYGCVCDSAWEVGLGSGETQEPEWFGPDCSLRHCPSGDDPNTVEDETNCFNVTSSSVYSATEVRRLRSGLAGASQAASGLFLVKAVRLVSRHPNIGNGDRNEKGGR